MRQQHSENVVSGSTVDLRKSVDARQVGRLREADAGGRGGHLFLGDTDRRVIVKRAVNGLRDGQAGLRRRGLSRDGNPHGQSEKHN